MSDRAGDRDQAIARLLFATHLPFLAMVWAVFAAAVLVLIIGIDLLGTVTRSVWDPAVSMVRWFALGYGAYLINRLLPVYVAHGRTRREFLRSVACSWWSPPPWSAGCWPSGSPWRRCSTG